MNGRNQSVVLSIDIPHPDGIAIDWAGRNMYWADSGADRIEIARLTGKYRRVICL